MEEDNKQNYISLAKAASLCSYSEPYLRLRARQGKLKSIKLGKKWVTTIAWLDDYAAKIKEWNESMEQKKGKSIAAVLAVQDLVKAGNEKELVTPSIDKNVGIEDIQCAPRAVFAADDNYNPYFYRWGEQKNQIGFNNLNFFKKLSVKKTVVPAAGQILPSPQAKELNTGKSVDRWAGMGAILSGAVCSLALFLAVSSSSPQNWNLAQGVNRYVQANASLAVADNSNGLDYPSLSNGSDAATADGSLGLGSEYDQRGALEKFVDWAKQFIENL